MQGFGGDRHTSHVSAVGYLECDGAAIGQRHQPVTASFTADR